MDDAYKGLESSAESIYHSVRGTDAATLTNPVYTKFRTPSAGQCCKLVTEYRNFANFYFGCSEPELGELADYRLSAILFANDRYAITSSHGVLCWLIAA
jgi:hypothetical protein